MEQDLRATLFPSCFADTKWLGSAVKAHGLRSLEGGGQDPARCTRRAGDKGLSVSVPIAKLFESGLFAWLSVKDLEPARQLSKSFNFSLRFFKPSTDLGDAKRMISLAASAASVAVNSM